MCADALRTLFATGRILVRQLPVVASACLLPSSMMCGTIALPTPSQPVAFCSAACSSETHARRALAVDLRRVAVIWLMHGRPPFGVGRERAKLRASIAAACTKATAAKLTPVQEMVDVRGLYPDMPGHRLDAKLGHWWFQPDAAARMALGGT